ncbi:TVP38/TMEM64 family protein [Vibrio rumoiensis]|uniref:TVP38/TMEM64 family membrane protein n=1 Tax=Vibrio rumoiensis TaxID=76258 RepID=A0ABW7IY08_9VIBR
MKSLIRVILIIAACFGTTFLIIKFSGLLTIEQIEYWLERAQSLSTALVALIIVMLLFADLFIAVPTLTIVILSGYFLGHAYGAVSSLFGIMLAGIVGYIVSYRYGNNILNILIKEKQKRTELIHSFEQHGFAMILLSRSIPILPEVTACLSGMTKMRFTKFLLAWMISSIPYVVIASYAGSISTIDNPQPAIFTAIGISSLLWLCWFLYQRNIIRQASKYG